MAQVKNVPSDSDDEDAWKVLDDRPIPQWYPDAKFGIFMHWGVFSVPSFGSEWFWYSWKGAHDPDYEDFVNRSERRGFDYKEYAARFKAELYAPQDWAQLFADAGAQYVVLTSKHHEGFCMWNSTDIRATRNWNAVEVGPRRDLLGELSQAIQATSSPHTGRTMQFGVHHSLFEWFNPMFAVDAKNGYRTNKFVTSKTLPELYDLVNRYHPTLIWSDGAGDAPSSYWNSTDFLKWYAFESPVADQAVWNDRWGKGTMCNHGSFLTCQDQPGKLQLKKWENCVSVDKTSWGLNRKATYQDYMTIPELIHLLIETVAFNGNLLLNVGPAADGTIPPIFADRLLGIGNWLKVNGKAIYGTRPWLVCQNETDANAFYTRDNELLYVHLVQWPSSQQVILSSPMPSADTTVTMLGLGDTSTQSRLETRTTLQGLEIMLPALTPDRLPCQHAWVLVLTNIQNLKAAEEEEAKILLGTIHANHSSTSEVGNQNIRIWSVS